MVNRKKKKKRRMEIIKNMRVYVEVHNENKYNMNEI